MNRNLCIFALAIATGCAIPKYAWRVAPEKNVKQLQADLTRCQRDSYMVSPGYYGNGQEKYFTACMYQAGHYLEEITEHTAGQVQDLPAK
jgi:hypothetical protein